ncbi:MAG: hypothetical protein QOD76_1321 [Solirubrobacteraceae bacterium]|nr:hypothetical protein [Solirubrobacteraceae bacterium]
MNFFRDLFVDLVDKRLWPVAAVLVGALVVVPLVLSKSPSTTQTRAAVAPAVSGPDVPGQRVSLGGEPTVSVHGEERDPFKQQFVQQQAAVSGLGAAVAQAASSTATPSLTTTPSSVSSGGGTSSSGTSGSGSSGSSGSSKTTSSSGPTSQIEVKFGKATSKLKTYKLNALNALPGNGDPLLIFTGLLKDGKTAVFLVTSDATSQGDGKCSPSGTVCASLLMKADQVEFLDVVDASGTTVQYELDMQGVLHK